VPVPEIDERMGAPKTRAAHGTLEEAERAHILATLKETLMFNGYADQVQSLYPGMDLRRNY